MNKQLILFTEGFPFGLSEAFLETELKYLTQEFDKVSIVAVNPANQIKRKIPSNCEVFSLHLDKTFKGRMYSLRYLVHPEFRKELFRIKKIYRKKITSGIISTMLVSLYNADQARRFTEKTFLEAANKKLTLYSYWCDDNALSLAFLQKKYANIKTCSRAHGWDVYFEVNKVQYLPYRHFIFNNLSALFPVSQMGKDQMNTVWKVGDVSKAHVFRLGVPGRDVEYEREDSGLIVSCSNIIPLKRLDLLIKTLSELKGISLKWVHFGEGYEFRKIKDLARKCLHSPLNFEFKGAVPNAEIMDWYKQYQPDLFINLSSSEGIPVSIMEALSFGIPVIATKVGGVPEVVNNENGYLVPPDPTEISQTIAGYFQSSAGYKENKRKAAYKTWKTFCNADDNYTRFCKEIAKL